MATAFQKIMMAKGDGILSKGNSEYPEHYDLGRFRIFEDCRDIVLLSVTDEFGNVIMGFEPMDYDKAMEIIDNSITTEQINKRIETI